MSEQNQTETMAESALLDQEPPVSKVSNYDEVPIGGGNNKFNFSQFPSENEQPPPRKNVTKKTTKGKKQQPKNIVPASAMQKEELPPKNTQPLDQIPVGGNNSKGVFDQKPIGKSQNAFNISEFPQGQPEQPVATNYTMAQKLKSKAVKMRLSGLEDLLALLTEDPTSSEIDEFSITTFLKQTTPANMEKSLQCFKVWMEVGRSWGEDETKYAIEGGFINGKANTKKLTVQIVDDIYERKPDMVEMTILLGFKSKTPKIIAGYISILNELLAIYGIKRMKFLKPYISEIVRVVGAQKLAAVKNEGMNNFKEAYKWLGKEVVEPMLGKLKENLKKELDSWWESYQKSQVMSAPKDIPDEGGNKAKGKKIDAYDLSEAVDIFKKYNDKWTDTVLKTQKWNQKIKLMEEFVKAASVPKLANTEFRGITELFRRLINDSNFNVVIWTLKIAAAMAKGLRKYYASAAKAQFFNIIGKFREKRTQMVEETFNTLGEFGHCISLQDVLEDVKEALGDKAPNMRVNVINWVGKHLDQKAEEKGGQLSDKTRDGIKKLFPIFQKLLQDGVAEVRDAMVRSVAKLEMLLGEDFFAPIKGKLSTKMASKINSKVQEKQDHHDRSSKKVPQQTEMSKSGVSMKGNIKANDSKVNLSKTMAAQKKEEEKAPPLQCYDEPLFDESLQTLIGLGFPEEEVKNVTANGANERASVLNYLKENPYESFNAVIRVIRRAFKEWKEVNLKMNKDLIAYLQQRVGDIDKPSAYVLVPYISEKVGDSKFSEALLNLVIMMCERIPARFLTGHFIKYALRPENKKPKINGEICQILIKIIQTASIANCFLKEISEYARDTYAVPFSKKGAQELLICLYTHAGDQIKPYLDESTIKAMDGEFKSIKPLSQDQKKPKVNFEGDAAVESQVYSKKQVPKSGGKATDLSVQVQKALPLMNDNGNWQKRKDGAELLSSQLEFGGKVSFGNQLGDLLSTLKVHINDTNKQLIKVFVHLAGLVLVSLSEKDVRSNLKGFILNFVEGLSDKNQQNRIQIVNTLGRIAQNLGREHILSNLGSFLEGGKEGRLEVLHLILIHEEGIPKSDIRDYPKGLVNCLCDKNKDIRSTAEKVFEKVYQKLGIEVFRSIAKDQRPAVAKDLNTFFDRFQRNDRNANTTSSLNSKGVSPNKPSQKPRNTLTQPPQPPTSAKKRSLSKNNPGTKSFVDHDDDPHAVTAAGPCFVQKLSKVEGHQLFAHVKTLINERVERQSNQELYVWRLDEIKQHHEDAIRLDIESLIRQDIAKKLLSMDYKRVFDGMSILLKASKDINYQVQFKELFDIILKWVLMRLWGGQPSLCHIIELVFPLLSILEKKRAVLNDFEVDLVLAIIREYMISASLVGPKVSESLYSIIKCLIPLSSGERVLRKVLRQFSYDLPNLHRHLKRQVNAFYREGLCRLIKKELADHVGNEDTLEEASKIKELKEDPEFVSMLFRRFHEDVLRCFGFKKLDGAIPAGNRSPHGAMNESGVSHKHPPPPPQNNGSFVETARDRSAERMPPVGHPSTMSQDLRPSHVPNKPMDRKYNLSQHNIVRPPAPQNTQDRNERNSYTSPSAINPNTSASQSSKVIPQSWSDPYDIQTLDLSCFPAPHPASPLSKHLNKLLPPNESIINFFNTLFQETGEKIANELATNAKIIFGSILKSVQELISVRKDYTPERIVAQISLLQSCIKCTHVMKNIGELLGYGTEFALTQLVYEDEHKSEIYQQLRSRNIEYRADNFIKAINGVMLRILENSNPQDAVNVLLELLTYHYKCVPQSGKTISLVAKCIGRVSKEFGKEMRPQAIRMFILKALQFLSAIDYDTSLEQIDSEGGRRERMRSEDNTANSIKSILIEICKSIGSEVWEHYQKVIGQFQGNDKWIGNFISSLNVKIPERGRGRSQPNKENEQLKKINELLSKNKSYESGIALLKKYTERHPEFNAEQYFSSLNYDRKFIQMVIGSLDGRRSMARASSREQEAPESIQDRIKRLKERFQEIQPEGEGSGNSSMNRGNPGQQEEEVRQERALQIRRRIQQMKNKMNSAVRNNR